MHRLNLSVLPDPLAICRLPPGAPVPPWALGGELTSVTWTGEETSIVCREAAVPPDVTATRGWRALKVQGPLPFDMTGVLASLAQPLAEAQIPVFATSTYDTDYLLVPASQLEAARSLLTAARHTIRFPTESPPGP